MADCIVDNNTVKFKYDGYDKKIKQIGETARGLIHVVNHIKTDSLDEGILDPIKGVESVNELIGNITNGKYKTAASLETAPVQTKNFVHQHLQQLIKDSGIVADKGMAELNERMVGAEAFSNFVHYMRKLRKSEDSLHTLYTLNKKIGPDFELMNFELINNNRYLMMKRHKVAKHLYAEYQMFKNYLSHGKALIGKYEEILRTYNKSLKIDTKKLAEMLTYYDKQHEEGKPGLMKYIDEHMDDKDFKKLSNRIAKSFNDISHDELQAKTAETIVKAMDDLHSRYRVLNDKQPGDESGISTIVGFTEGANKKLLSLLQFKKDLIKQYNPEMTDEEVDDMLNPIEVKYMERLSDWSPREGYVPARNSDETDLYSDILKKTEIDKDNNDLSYKPVLSFLNKRKEAITGSSNSEKILLNNLMALTHIYGHISQYTMASTIKLTMETERGGKWQENNPGAYNTLKYFSEKMLDYLKPRKELSAPLQAMRNIGLIMAGTPALILGGINSIVSNLAGGFMGYYSKFGIKTFNDMYKQYKKAPDAGIFEKIIHDNVASEIKIRHMQPGRLADYKSFDTKIGDSDTKNGLVKSTKAMRDTVFKIFDAVTAKGVMWFIPAAHAITTMHGSENYLQAQSAGELYAKVYNELYNDKISGEFDLKTEEGRTKFKQKAQDTVQHYKQEVYYNKLESVGDFSQENKPFWTWARLKYAQNFPDILIGTAGALWGAFRQVATHNLDRFSKAGIATFFDVKDGQKTTANLMKGYNNPTAMRLDIGVSFAGAIALAIYEMITWTQGKKGWKFPTLMNINPFQETNAVLQAGYVGLSKAFLNLPCSEEMADEGIKKILQLAGGVGGGNTLREMYQGAENQDMSGVVDQLNPLKIIASYFDIPSVLGEMSRGITASEYYDYKKEVMGPLQNAYPATNYLNDYLRTAFQLMPVIFAKGRDDIESDILSQKKLETVTQIVASLTGVRGYNNVNEAWKAHYGKIKLNNKIRYMIERNANRSTYQPRTIVDRLVQGVAKYGNINPKYIYPEKF